MFRSLQVNRLMLTTALLAASSLYASAGVVSYTGADFNAGPGDPHPNSGSAQSLFLSAASGLGTVNTLTFESSPVGTFTVLTPAPGVTVTSNAFSYYVNNTPNYVASPPLDGFNTTSGGAKYIEQQGGTLTFTFANPIQAFGAYLPGTQLYFFADYVTFNDGTTQTILLPGMTDGTGALDYIGFTDAGKSISSVSVVYGTTAGGDFAGVDDVSYVATNTTVTPEPSSFALLLTGVGAVGAGYRRFKARHMA